MKMHHVSNKLITEVIEFLATQIKNCDVEYDYVVGVARGGMIPATMLAYKLDIPVLCYSASSYNDTKQEELKVHQYINFKTIDKCPLNILVVDDICDSGDTFEWIRKLQKDQVDIETHVALFSKKSSIHVPDIIGLVTYDNEWIVFPWE